MNEFIDRFNSYPLGQRVLVLIIVMVAMYGVYYMSLHVPLQDEVKSLENQLVQLQQEKDKFDQLKRSRSEVLARVEQLKRELYVAREKLPLTAEIPSLLQRIHNQAKTAGLDITVFQRQPDVARDYYIEIPVSMQLMGSYDELANFFYFLGRMTRIVNIKDINMTVVGKDSATGELNVTAQATTFRYKGEGAAAPAPGQ